MSTSFGIVTNGRHRAQGAQQEPNLWLLISRNERGEHGCVLSFLEGGFAEVSSFAPSNVTITRENLSVPGGIGETELGSQGSCTQVTQKT